MFRIVQVLLLLLLSAPTATAQNDEEEKPLRDYLEEEHSLAIDFETPHTKWAKPHPNGPVRVVFFAPWSQGSTKGREIVELLQRFDIDGSAVYTQGNQLVGDNNPNWYGGDPEAGTKRMLRLLAEPPQVVVVNGLTWEGLPKAVRDGITNHDGGLVWIGDATGVPHPDIVADSGKQMGVPEGAYYDASNRRVAFLPQRQTVDFGPEYMNRLDYQFAGQGKAILWASGERFSNGRPFPVRPDEPLTFDRNDPPPFQFPYTPGESPRFDDEYTFQLRRSDGPVEKLGVMGKGTAAVVVVPRLREGAYSLDVFKMHQGNPASWNTLPFTITADRHVDAIELAKDWAESGEVVTGTVQLSGNVAPGDTLRVALVDPHGRIVAQHHLTVEGTAIPFSLTIEPWMAMLLRVEAILLDSEGLDVSGKQVYLRHTTRNRDQFNFVMWNYATDDLGPYSAHALAKYGVTSVLQGGPPPPFLAEAGLTYVPYTTSFRASSHTLTAMINPETGLLKTGCVHDPVTMAETIARVVEAARTSRELGTFAYSLGDENAVRASCLGPECIKAYREYLRAQYGTIAALNAEWDAAYPSFDAIELIDEGELPAADAPQWFVEHYHERTQLHRTDNEGAEGELLDTQVAMGDINDEIRALQEGNFARWYDRQAFQSHTYIEWCKQFQDAFKTIDPQAWTGFEGTDSFSLRKLTTRSRQGGDLDRFVRDLDYYGSYEGPGNEVMRSIAPKGFPMGSWIGYTPDAEELLEKYWRQILDRMNCVQWWRWDNLNGYHGYLAPNLAPFPATQELFDDTQIVRDGLGTLLMGLDMHDDRIAMLYSMPSTHIAHFDGNETYGEYTRDHAKWHQVLHGAGVQFRYITDRMLREGEFNPKDFDVLILPQAFAMTAEEAAAIRAFAEQGGTVIADVRPALYDGHCKPLAAGQLDDLFGIARDGKRDARTLDRLRVNGELNGEQLSMEWGNWHGKDIYPRMLADPAVRLTTGEAMGKASPIHFWTGLDVPVCIVNEVGKGRAVLLNFNVYDAPMDNLIQGLLAASGVRPALRLTDLNGAPITGIEVSRWQNGSEEIIGLLGTHPREVRVYLSEPQHVYVAKEHAYLGHLSEVVLKLKPNRACMLVVADTPIAPVTIELPKSARQGSRVRATLRTSSRTATRAVQMSATAPDGTPAPWVRDVAIIEGQTEIDVAIAYNDAVGDWTFTATELFTGNAVSTNVTVTRAGN